MNRLAAVRRTIEEYVAPWRLRWVALAARDRRAALVMSCALLVFAVWQLLVLPASRYAERQEGRLAVEYDNLGWMQANAAAARQVGGARGKALPAGQSLLSTVSASARETGLNLQRFEPEGESRVRVTLENAVFTDVMRWLVEMERRYGVSVANLAADAQSVPGVVNIRLTLEQRGS